MNTCLRVMEVFSDHDTSLFYDSRLNYSIAFYDWESGSAIEYDKLNHRFLDKKGKAISCWRFELWYVKEFELDGEGIVLYVSEKP